MMYSPRAQRFVPLSTKQVAAAVWNRTVQPYSIDVMPMFAPLHKIAAEKACELLEGVESPHILDIGSAAGEPALSVAQALGDSQVVATDFSGLAAVGGRARAVRAGTKNLIFQFSDAEDLQFDEDSFDLVICCLVLSACDEEPVLYDIERILKPGGAVLIIDFDDVSAVDYLRPLHAAVAASVPDWERLHHSFGLQPWRLGVNPERVTADLKSLGFENVCASSGKVALDTGTATDEEMWKRAEGAIQALLETMRDIDQTDVIDAEALAAKNAFLAALQKEPASALSRFPHTSFRMWTGQKPDAKQNWSFF